MKDLLRMWRSWRSGRYHASLWKTLALFGALVVYFVSPIDLIPDYIPFVGVVDDLALLGFFLRSVHRDLETFRAWERQQKMES